MIEVLSPDDETRQKLPFYAARGVDAVVIVDPARRSVEWLTLAEGSYAPLERSGLLELGPAELSNLINWS